jgi:hypothetical protein
MSLLIGAILVALALFSVIAVMYFVVTEKEVHEEHYIPPADEPEQSGAQ